MIRRFPVPNLSSAAIVVPRKADVCFHLKSINKIKNLKLF
jgi:hypothetical protein